LRKIYFLCKNNLFQIWASNIDKHLGFVNFYAEQTILVKHELDSLAIHL